MAGHSRVYRSLVRLYPKSFRGEYADDLVQSFDDLLADVGPALTWRRTAVDLVVTIPRYRLETAMNPHHTNTALVVITSAAVALAAIATLTGALPGGPIWLVLAVVMLISSGSRLARSTRPPDTALRRHLLRRAAALGVICLVGSAAMWIELGVSEDWNGGKLLVYNAFFFATSIGALVCLFLGLRTPRSGTEGALIAAR
jgi:hypothetical protein